MHTLYTLGYASVNFEQLRQAAQARGALLLDIRFAARARRPEWNKGRLTAAFGDQYQHLQSLGNQNYKSGGAIELVDPDAGLAIVRDLLDNQPVILLCGCKEVDTCHRKVVAELAQAAFGCDVQHLTPTDLSDWLTPPEPPREVLVLRPTPRPAAPTTTEKTREMFTAADYLAGYCNPHPKQDLPHLFNPPTAQDE